MSDQPTPPGRAQDDPGPTAPGTNGDDEGRAEEPGESAGEGQAAASDAEHALAQRVGPAGAQPPRPPKRTGVFVDPDELREHVGALLRAILGGYEVDAFGNFTFKHEGARVFVTVGGSPIGPQVGVFSVTNLGLDLTPQLGGYLLTTNHRLGFGAFSYDPPNEAVWLRHTLLGATLDGPELQAAVAAVASTAAAFDDEIRDRFGGRTFTEAPSEVQQRMGPPDPSSGPHGAGGYL